MDQRLNWEVHLKVIDLVEQDTHLQHMVDLEHLQQNSLCQIRPKIKLAQVK